MPYAGGFCRWWYTLIENIAVFPTVDPLSQILLGAPTLKADTTWYGPVNVPDGQLGWDENMQQGKPGPWYKQKVFGFIPGFDAESHINLQNLAYHQLVVVGKVRAGGNFFIIGNGEAGLEFVSDLSTGQGAAGTPGTRLTLVGESIDKALILPAFAPANSLLPPGSSATAGSSSGGSNASDMETISFTNVNIITVAYNSTRRTRFGDFPNIEVWQLDPATGQYYKNTAAEILVDNQPPNQSTFTVKPGNNSTGFIILSN